MFSYSGFVFVLTVALSISNVLSTSLPSYIRVCKRSDPNIDQCLFQSVEAIKPYLKSGIPELGIPPGEPLEIPLLNIPSENGEGNAAIGRNLKVYGTTDFTLEKVKMDLSNQNRPVIHFAVNIPRLKFDGEYEVNTKILVLPIKGKGPIKLDAVNTKADAILYGQTYKKGNKVYLRYNRMDLALKMQDYTVHLGNLFKGDKLLEEATNQALNENKKEFKEALNPIVTKYIIELVLEFANNMTKNYPYDVLFPPQ